MIADAQRSPAAAADGRASWYGISVGCRHATDADGRRALNVTPQLWPLDADGAARWLDASMPAVLAATRDEAQRVADAYAAAWIAATDPAATETPAAPQAADERPRRRGRRVAFVAPAQPPPDSRNVR